MVKKTDRVMASQCLRGFSQRVREGLSKVVTEGQGLKSEDHHLRRREQQVQRS